jgi:hypothetical protein
MEMPGAVCTSAQRLKTRLTIVSDFTHEMARSRAYRWGEDGIAGVCDSHGLQNVAFAFWNGEEYVHAHVVSGLQESNQGSVTS